MKRATSSFVITLTILLLAACGTAPSDVKQDTKTVDNQPKSTEAILTEQEIKAFVTSNVSAPDFKDMPEELLTEISTEGKVDLDKVTVGEPILIKSLLTPSEEDFERHHAVLDKVIAAKLGETALSLKSLETEALIAERASLEAKTLMAFDDRYIIPLSSSEGTYLGSWSYTKWGFDGHPIFGYFIGTTSRNSSKETLHITEAEARTRANLNSREPLELVFLNELKPYWVSGQIAVDAYNGKVMKITDKNNLPTGLDSLMLELEQDGTLVMPKLPVTLEVRQ